MRNSDYKQSEQKKVKRMINWTPRIPFEKGLNKTIVYYAKKLKK